MALYNNKELGEQKKILKIIGMLNKVWVTLKKLILI